MRQKKDVWQVCMWNWASFFGLRLCEGLIMSGKEKKRMTLFSHRFTKHINKHSGLKYDVTSQVLHSKEVFSCEVCKKLFKAKHYLNSHMLHKDNANLSNTTGKDNPEYASKLSFLRPIETSDKPQSAKKRRRSDKRKSYTIDFKLQTLKLLDKVSQIASVKDRW